MMEKVDVYELCRTCLKLSKYYTNIYKERSRNGSLLYDVINELCELGVSVNDGLPEFLCCECFKKLHEFKLFKTNAQKGRSELILMKKDMENEVWIKKEPPESLDIVVPAPTFVEDSLQAIIKQEEVDIDCSSDNAEESNENGMQEIITQEEVGINCSSGDAISGPVDKFNENGMQAIIKEGVGIDCSSGDAISRPVDKSNENGMQEWSYPLIMAIPTMVQETYVVDGSSSISEKHFDSSRTKERRILPKHILKIQMCSIRNDEGSTGLHDDPNLKLHSLPLTESTRILPMNIPQTQMCSTRTNEGSRGLNDDSKLKSRSVPRTKSTKSVAKKVRQTQMCSKRNSRQSRRLQEDPKLDLLIRMGVAGNIPLSQMCSTRKDEGSKGLHDDPNLKSHSLPLTESTMSVAENIPQTQMCSTRKGKGSKGLHDDPNLKSHSLPLTESTMSGAKNIPQTRKCSAINCGRTRGLYGDPNLKLHSFPRTEYLCREWLARTGNPALYTMPRYTLHSRAFLCEHHFRPCQYKSYEKRKLRPGALPLIFPTVSSSSSSP